MKARSLSRTEARVVLSLEEEGREDTDLKEIASRARISAGFARKVAHDLVQKGWLQRVGRGRYLLNPSSHGPDAIPDLDPLRIGSRIAAPYYFGYATAAELLGLLPQASRVYYVVTPARGTAIRSPVARYRRITVASGRFFGFRELVRRGQTLSVSDAERTVLDCLSRPEFSGGLGGVVQVLTTAARRLDWSKLGGYLERLGSRSLALRLGYLIEWSGPLARAPKPWLDRLRAQPAEPFVPLGFAKEFGRRGPRDPRWHVIQNVPDAVLRAEVEPR